MLACALAPAEEYRTPSGVLKLDLPPGYTRLSDEEISVKFGRNGRVPAAVWGNARRSSSVAVTWTEMKNRPLNAADLPEFKKAMEQLLPRATPGLKFLANEIVSIGAQQWVFFDSSAPTVDTEVRNLMYLTHLGGHMVGVNYNATVADFPEQKDGFEASARTLAVAP
ncbi:MAG: hypothetical protein EOO54_02945 [Haliea sp.]|nr:MAG: hypothetical protein EOO54_02945 [Haliea sp.]